MTGSRPSCPACTPNVSAGVESPSAAFWRSESAPGCGSHTLYLSNLESVQWLSRAAWGGQRGMTNLLRGAAVVCLLLVGSGSAWAQIEPIPKTSGFSGFAQLGAMYMDVESNMVAGNSLYNVGNSTISSLTASPSSNTDVAPIINFDLRYTFASTRTQLFLGNALEDFLRLDLTALAGVRQGVSDKSSVW